MQQKPGSSNIKGLLLIKENQTPRVNEFSTLYGRMQESGLIDIIPLVCTLTIYGQYPAFLHLESPAFFHLRVAAVAAVAAGLMPATSFVY